MTSGALTTMRRVRSLAAGVLASKDIMPISRASPGGALARLHRSHRREMRQAINGRWRISMLIRLKRRNALHDRSTGR